MFCDEKKKHTGVCFRERKVKSIFGKFEKRLDNTHKKAYDTILHPYVKIGVLSSSSFVFATVLYNEI